MCLYICSKTLVFANNYFVKSMHLCSSLLSLNLDCHFIANARCIIDNEASDLIVLCLNCQGYLMMKDIEEKYNQ